jgi:uncharacterized membrane protein YphA (DoxX/SURF4 family)
MLVLIVLLAAWLVFRAIGAAGVHVFASWQHSALYALAVMFVFTATAHFNKMKHDLAQMIPSSFPRPLLIVYITGVLELLGAAGLVLPRFRRLAGICLVEPTERERFAKHWESVQSRFVDSPKGAVAEADDLVSSLMKTRGYPVSDVDHRRVVENYRSAHEIALRVGKDEATTEDLRTAMIHYRSLFEELMQVPMIVERKEVA